MKNKLLLGCMGVCSVLGVLVACGSGEITSFATDDQVAELTFTTNLEKEKSIKACLADPVCQAEYQTAQNPPSSAVITSSSSIITPTSSTSIIPGSSSSLFQLSSGGGGNPIQSSSSLVIVVSSQSSGGIAGVCAPEPAIVELGQEVTWSFSKDASVDASVLVPVIMAATYDWAFEGGSEVSYSGTGVAAISKKITYSTSGSHSATLSINGDVAMTCSPVQVNGAKITGCTCDVDNASPDVAAGGVATWTVTGCITTANITGYSWDNAIAAPSSTFSHTFTAKDETYTPTLNVSNDDNTIQPVVCPAAKAIDATLPDYLLDGTETGTYTLQAGTYSMQYACNASAYHQPSISIAASGNWEKFNVTYSTQTTPNGTLLASEQHTISFTDLFGSWSGALPTEMISITVDHAAVIKCQ